MTKLSVDQALLKAQSHMEEAQKLYKAILQSEPNNLQAQKRLAYLTESIQPSATQGPPQEMLDQLVTLYNRGQLEQLIDLALAIIEEYPEAVLVWNILGVANKRLDKTQQALNSFKKVTELNPNYADGFNNLGVCLKGLGVLDKAIKAFQFRQQEREAITSCRGSEECDAHSFTLNSRARL